MKLPVQKIPFTLAISWIFLSCTPVQARSAFNPPPPPPDINEPGQRSEAGSRGCEDKNKQLTSAQKKLLTALVPVSSNVIFGTTIAEHPTFWFYTPYQSPSLAQFVLYKDDQQIYITDVTLPKTPGIISVSLPQAVAPLSIGKPYRWFFKIYCQPQKFHTHVEGLIQRNSLNPTLKSQLDKATPSDRFTLYDKNGIWFEALSTAAELRRRNPKDTSWAALLQAVGLNDFINEPAP